MARRTKLESLQSRIAALQAKADQIRKDQEKGDVIDKIKVAIEHYGITAAELYDGKPAKMVKIPRPKKASAPKYRDPATGATWTGVGKRPRWFVAAIEGGATPESLAA